ncbi:hypothetical protein QNO07_23535 [Streptomyces sp. 549]|uniref:hypothetical protein n=1 Tax=Streptomyces sp. 549 TaxID=3049076 RepID=UPI0024C3CFEF|nr:hypothetical protein [Streptomyces sp. 549]MDK1476351.1 hypothetical protein [Streptomyces sp. 549]
MGWTHDFRDVSHNYRNKGAVPGTPALPLRDPRDPQGSPHPQLGIPRILRRRARWVGARLRGPRR